jgi:ketosteroid isomerase-like protein
VTNDPITIARSGLEAWRRGDFGALERLLARDVQWRWFEPGSWDCNGRDDVMRTLRERYEQGFTNGELLFREAGQDAVIAVAQPSEIGGPEWPDETATVMRFRDGRVVEMQDYSTEAEAFAAASPS